MANIVLGVMQLISIIFVSIYEYNKKSIAVFLWATLLVMFGIPHVLSILTGTFDYGDDVMIKASIFVVLFNFLYIIIKFILYEFAKDCNGFSKDVSVSNVKISIVANGRFKRLNLLYFFLLLLSFAILVFYTYKYLGGFTSASWGNFRKISAALGFKSMVRYANVILMGASGVFLVYLNNNKKIMAIISMTIIILYTLITGNRIMILPVLVSIILNYYFLKNKKLNLKTIIAVGICGFLTIYLVYFLRLLRIYGGFYNMFNSNSLIELNARTLEMLLNGDGELSLRNAFYHFIYYDNNFANFNKGHTYIRLLLVAFPTFVLKGIKPPDFAISMGSAWSMNPHNTSFSIHPTLYGDCFANLWWFGIILGIFWAFFSFFIDKFIHKKNDVVKVMLMVLFGTAFVIAGRGSVYNGFFSAFVGTILILVTNLVSRVKL